MNNYRIICYWPSEVWAVQERIEKDDHTNDWMEAHRCTAKGEDGYKEAKQWIKENDK
jgi:hypothetical protein